MAINPPIEVLADVAAAEAAAGWRAAVRRVRAPPAARRGRGRRSCCHAVVGAASRRSSPYDPLAIDFGAMLAPPSAHHWLGTDAFGRDVLSRLIYGSRTALLVGFGASVLGATLGAVLGVGSAYFGGRVDLYLQRLMDIFLVVPAHHPRAGPGGHPRQRLPNLILAITIPDDPALRPGHPLLAR